MTPNDQLPGIKDQMVGGPKGDYHWYLDVLVLLPVFCIEYFISKKLGRISGPENKKDKLIVAIN